MPDESPTVSDTMHSATSAEPVHPAWVLIRDALADSRWRYRSVEGIASTTCLERGEVERTLKGHQGEIRTILARSRHYRGVRQVHTLRSRPLTLRDIAIDVLGFAGR